MSDSELIDRIAELEKKIETLESRYEKALQRTEQMYDLTKSRFEKIPDSALFSENYFKRAFAAFGHVLVGGAIIYTGLLILEGLSRLF
jgi:hypothetical protein